MLRSFFAFFLIASTGFPVAAQTLYVLRNIQLAYKNNTRSPDGRPGPRYWQNTGRYEITLDAAPPDRTVCGQWTAGR